MTDQEIYEEVSRGIAEILVKVIKADRSGRQTEVDAADQILSIPHLFIEGGDDWGKVYENLWTKTGGSGSVKYALDTLRFAHYKRAINIKGVK